MKRIAINGMGRIGKLLLRDLAQRGVLNRVALVNEPVGDPAQLAHLLEFDTVHGRWQADIGYNDEHVIIGKQKIKVSQHSRIAKIPPQEHRIGFVVDCSGAFRDQKTLQKYFDANVNQSAATQCFYYRLCFRNAEIHHRLRSEWPV